MPQGLKKGWWWPATLATLGGIASSLYLTQKHFLFLKTGYVGQSLCNLSPYMNCDAVLMSRFAEIGTFPIAGIGLLFYVYLLGALIYSRVEPEEPFRILNLPYLLIIMACLLSFFLAYVSFFYIHSFCIFCASLYVINILLLIFVKLLMGNSYKEWIQNFKKISWKGNFLYLALVFIIGGSILYTNEKPYAKEISQEALDQYLNTLVKAPPKEFQIKGRPTWGKGDGSITIVEFSDFECPYCKNAAFFLKPVLTQYQEKVKLVFLNYPLDSSCNPIMEKSLHVRACAVAYAAHCAGKQGKFWEFHDKAFARQPRFQPSALEKIAKKLNLNLKEFNACLDDEATKAFVAEDIAQGRQAGIQGTPSIFVNGHLFQLWPYRKAWKQLIERLSQIHENRPETTDLRPETR